MKVTIRRDHTGALSAYMPKKDLEEAIVETQNANIWGGWVELANGWRLLLPAMEVETPLPITVDARRIDT